MNTWPELEKQLNHYLCPAGNGVYTIHTAQEKKAALHQKLYGVTDAAVQQQWLDHLKQLPDANLPLVLGVCSDNGGGILRGATWGPLFVRKSFYDLADHTKVFDLGDVRVIPHLLMDKYLNQDTIKQCRKALYHDEKLELAVSPLSITEAVAKNIYQTFPDKKIFGIGGDHSVSYPLVKSFLQHKKSQGIKTALIHFDAHTDLLAERLGIDICFGSWTYHILDDLPARDCLIQIGIRSSGKDKTYWQSQFGIKQYWANEVCANPEKVTAEIIQHLKQQNIEELYISFDIDGLDAKYASATGTPETNGLNPDIAVSMIQTFSKTCNITGADLMEVAPFTSSIVDYKHQEPETTLKSAATLMQCLTNAM